MIGNKTETRVEVDSKKSQVQQTNKLTQNSCLKLPGLIFHNIFFLFFWVFSFTTCVSLSDILPDLD